MSRGDEHTSTAASFAELLRDLRERAGLTQQELAERAALTPHAVSALERGMRTRPYPHTVRSLADALGASDAERSALQAAVPRRNAAVAGAPATVPAAAAATEIGGPPSPAPTGLVVPPTKLYGREDDLASVACMLRGGERLVTLLGPGGVGKTRLAAALSSALAGDFPDGVVQVSLAPILNAADVVPALGRALGMAIAPDIASIAAEIGDRRLLLVLDNFEHLLSTAADVGRLVALCPRLAVLTSSRSPLRVRVEREHPVLPLALPDASARSEADLMDAPAGALMADRARGHAPGGRFTSDQVKALAELTHRLSGLPLAIELATARLRTLSPQVLLTRLEESMDASGARDLPERQRTMRNTLDWSFGLLTPGLQDMFTLLGAFRGGADLETVEGVAVAAEGIERSQVLPMLEQLVEHSLVVLRPGPTGTRFDMLEPVAQYARSRLLGEHAERVYHAHARYFEQLTARAAVGYERADAVEWLERIGADEANVLVAVERALDLGEPVVAGLATWNMWLYWWLRGRYLVGRRMAELCIDHDLPPEVKGRVYLTVATMSYSDNDLPAATDAWQSALALGRETGDLELLSKGTAGTGLAALGLGDLETAGDRFAACLPYGVDDGERGLWIRSLSHVWLGTTQLLSGQPHEAIEEITKGGDLARERGDRLCIYVALYNLAQASLVLGDDETAQRHLDEGIALSVETRDLSNIAYFMESMTVIESRAGRHKEVARLVGAVSGLRDVFHAVYAYYLPDETMHAAAEQAAREALGQDAYDDLVDAGRSMEITEVLEMLGYRL